LSNDHTTMDSVEVARVREAGGMVFCVGRESMPRVGGSLNMTRAFGDAGLRSSGLIAVPDVSVRARAHGDEFVIVATDGLWDTVTNEQAAELSRRVVRRCAEKGRDWASTARVLANVLQRAARVSGSMDNLTVIVIPVGVGQPGTRP
jgi:protein phosphatase 2C